MHSNILTCSLLWRRAGRQGRLKLPCFIFTTWALANWGSAMLQPYHFCCSYSFSCWRYYRWSYSESTNQWINRRRLWDKTTILTCDGNLLRHCFLVPTLWMVSGSLKSQNDFNQYPPSFIPQQMHFDNFTKLFNSFHFDVYLKNTIFVTIAIVLLSLLVNSMAAYALARLTFPGRNIIFLFVLGSMMIPFATYMIPLFMVIRQLGLINNLWGIVVIAIAHPFSIFLLRQFYMNFPKELEEAGRIDGLGLIGIFFDSLCQHRSRSSPQ